MQSSTKVLLAATAMALAGSATIAATLSPVHHLTVRLPNGGVEQISYTGAVVPKITILPANVQGGAMMPTVSLWTPVAGFDRISAQMEEMAAAMDRQMAVAMQSMAAMPFAEPNGPMSAAHRDLPAGIESYSMVSTISGRNTCVREVQIRSRGDGAQPEVVSHISGNCEAENSPGPALHSGDSPVNGQLKMIKAPLAAQPTTGRQHI